MTPSNVSSRHTRRLVFLVFGLCFVYLLSIDRPFALSIRERSLRLQQQRDQHSAPDESLNRRQIREELRAQVQRLETELEGLKRGREQLVARSVTQRSELLRPLPPATTLSRTLELLERHDLACLSSETITKSNGHTAIAPPFLKALSESLSEPANGQSAKSQPSKPKVSSADQMERREIHVMLRGSFENMRRAINELQDAPPCIYVLSLELQESSVKDGHHLWKLVILV